MFGGTCGLQLQNRRISRTRHQCESCGNQSNRLDEIADYIGSGRQMEDSRLSCSCHLPVRSVVCDSQWVLALHSVLRASQRVLNLCLPFPPVSHIIRNFGTPTAARHSSRSFHAQLILWTWRWRRYGPTKRRLTFNGLHGVISRMLELFSS
jgi:hypothetical protein